MLKIIKKLSLLHLQHFHSKKNLDKNEAFFVCNHYMSRYLINLNSYSIRTI